VKNTRNHSMLRLFGLALLAVGLTAGLASARDYQGKFTLPFEASWGQATLAPGDYTFTLEADAGPYTVRLRRRDQGVAIILAEGVSTAKASERSELIVVRHGKKGTIRALHLSGPGLVFAYHAPKAEKPMLAEGPHLIQRVPVYVAAK
jgi:hypothetical protein